MPDDFCLDFWVFTVALSCLLQFTPFLDVNTWVQCTSQNEELSFESKCIFLWCWTWVTHSNDNDGALFSVVCFSSFQQPSTWNMRRTAELINYPYFYPFSVGVVAKHWDKFFYISFKKEAHHPVLQAEASTIQYRTSSKREEDSTFKSSPVLCWSHYVIAGVNLAFLSYFLVGQWCH